MRRVLLLLLLCLLPITAYADLEAHFLDVGHGDCCIIICDGETMIIDGGDMTRSDKVYSAIKALGITQIKYAVASHPHDDHIGGLPAAFHAASVQTLLTPITDYKSERLDVLLRKAEQCNATVITPKAGDAYTLGGATIDVLSPAKHYYDINAMSLVLRITYGEHAFLFTGDATMEIEADLLAMGAPIKADVLKVSHHGSASATSTAFAEAVAPSFAVISCSDLHDNPSKDTLLALSGTKVLVTRRSDDIVLRSDGHTLTASAEVLPFSADEDDAEAEILYIGNGKSKVFHLITCKSARTMKEDNKVPLNSREEAESKGYRPCKNCSP